MKIFATLWASKGISTENPVKYRLVRCLCNEQFVISTTEINERIRSLISVELITIDSVTKTSNYEFLVLKTSNPTAWMLF